ncbi:MAG TPA: hypothetical protein VF491_15820 [Vicinamibacterales bacterium]
MVAKMARFAVALVGAVALMTGAAAAQTSHVSKVFSGAKVNAGTVTHTVQNGKNILRLSPDFQVPDTPDPHWQIVDSKGNVFLLQRLGIKGDKVNITITLPAYVQDVAKVQIYCAWAEAVLGETTFDQTLKFTN